KTSEAVARLENGETAVVLEISAFEDQGPPVITVSELKDETVPYAALKYAPLYFTAIITDDDAVASATFRWRADSVTTDDWMGELPMGYAGKDIWSVDLPIEEMLSLVPIALFDSTANIEFQIEAFDPSGNGAITPLFTMEISPPVASYTISDLDMTIDHELRGPEGTTLIVPSSAIPPFARDIPFLMRLTTHLIDEFPSPPQSAGDIGVIRTIDFEAMTPLIEEGTGDTLSASIPLPGFEHPVTLSLHYPQYAVTGMDEDLLGVYELNRATGTWIYVGGTVNPYGNLITISISSPGTFAVFFNPDFGYERGEVFSGITFSPNPFSPNGDGLYE
ncbi:MAG TPA: hypothetical protein VLA34_02295, partial [Candidatus Krumholzibacterium sp.]|nr:hypothetical protein [Candidatus Krumholzibacterium sp.]